MATDWNKALGFNPWGRAANIGLDAIGAGIASTGAARQAKITAGGLQNAGHAAQQQLAELERLNAPGMQAYYAGLQGLTGRLGLPTEGVAGAIPYSGPMTAFDPSAYLEGNPDVAAEYQRLSPNNLQNNLGISSPEQFAQWHYNQYGQYEPGRAGAPQPMGQPAAATPLQAEAAYQGGTGGVFGQTVDPTWRDPGQFSYGLDQYEASPAFQWQVQQAQEAIKAHAAATGSLRSGAAIKAINDRTQQMAYQNYAAERDFAFGQHRDARDFGRSIYESDRNYLTGRYDTGTNDLFRYTALGQQALGGMAGATANYGDFAASNAARIGQTYGDAAAAKANAWAKSFY